MRALIILLLLGSCTRPATLRNIRIKRIKYVITYTEYRAFPGGIIRPNGDTVFAKSK
jgi:hypothetical protein